MYKKTQTSQGDLFSGISSQVAGRKLKILEDPTSWHNIFYDQITRQIDEDIFSVLYEENNGRPNASIRRMVAMMVLKEGHGWSDEQLFEQCRFNIVVMRALGMLNFDEDVPANSTWYLFRKRMLEYYEVTGEDLMKQCFQRMTAEQIVMHGISGSKVRMDSKLINSNITNMNRLELILEVVRSFVKPLEIASIRDQIGEEGFELLTALQTKSVSNITYALSSPQQKELLVTLGVLIQQILVFCHGKNPEQYGLLKRLWNEQYTAAQSTDDDTDSGESNSGVQPRDPQDVSSSSVQSAHDSEATFRKKGNGKTEKKVKGYHGNITETCSPLNPFNLIVDVREANVGECDFLLPSLQASEEVFEQAYTTECTPQMQSRHIEHVTTDGGYDSLENRIAFTQEDAPHWNLSKTKGRESAIRFDRTKEGHYTAHNCQTGEVYTLTFSDRSQKYRVQQSNKTSRYYTEEQIEQILLRQQLLCQQRSEDRMIRPNVESSIHQVFHRLLKNEKVKYRGQYRSLCYVLYRAIWVNFRRIYQYEAKNSFISALLSLWRSVKALAMNRLDCQRSNFEIKNYSYLPS